MFSFNIKNVFFLTNGPINLQWQAGNMVGLSGASGSGKSRLLRALADMDEHQGEIVLNNLHQQTIPAHEWRKKVALLSAETQWWFDTVAEHFDDLSVTSLESLGFSSESLSWEISRLSSGEKQRLGLLRLLQNKPAVLLLDEPTANLDKQNSLLFENLVRDYVQTQPACVIWVSHDTQQLQRICQRQYVMQAGVLKPLP